MIDLHIPAQVSIATLRPLIPHLLCYLLSFAIIATYWIAHHSLLDQIERVDRNLLWLNTFILMAVAFVPFTTAMLASSPDWPVACTIYGLTLSAINLMDVIVWQYAKTACLLRPSFSMSRHRRIALLHATPIALYVCAAIASWRYPAIALGVYAFVPLFFAIPNRVVNAANPYV